ncbi:tolloid-like protein 2 [Pomacea canaliculata]|uniref:tolloid-like protein 2 n=1 Tax=Pomacea canaliculata TaxID=400727 RepID=UPI000D73BC7E|nr:tolloid-like protein 2 [Pomacea canaliculata]
MTRSGDEVGPLTRMKHLIEALAFLLLFGFEAIDAQGCGGNLSGAYGEFWSENYPNEYPKLKRNCTWHLTALPGTIIQLEFLDFDLEPVGLYSGYNYTACMFDYVIVEDPLSGTAWRDLCGNTLPPVMRGSGNILTVLFGSDTDDSYRGFKAQFQSNPCPDAINDCDHICIENQGSRSCLCYKGYILNSNDAKTCDDIDECAIRRHKCGQTCLNQPGSYTCDCDPGYRLMADGFACEDIDECTELADPCDQRCYNLPGSYACACDPQFTLTADESACEPVSKNAVIDNTTTAATNSNNTGYDKNLVLGLAIALAVSLLVLLLLLLHLCTKCCAKTAKTSKKKIPPKRRGSRVDVVPSQQHVNYVRQPRHWPGTAPDFMTSSAAPFSHMKRFTELPALSVQ